VYSALKRYLPEHHQSVYTTMNPEDKAFDDLTPKQQRVIYYSYSRLKDGVQRGEWTYAEIADDAGVDSSYPSDVLEDFEHVLDELEEKEPDLSGLEERMNPLKDEYAPPPVNRLRESAPGRDDVPAYDDLSENAQEIIDAFAESPEETVESVVESTRFNDEAVAQVLGEVPHIIAQEQAKRASTETLRGRYESRTDSQQAIIRELAREPVPTQPSRFKKDIAEAADTGGTYINYVIENFLELVYAVRIGKLDLGFDISDYQIDAPDHSDESDTVEEDSSDVLKAQSEGEPTTDEEPTPEAEQAEPVDEEASPAHEVEEPVSTDDEQTQPSSPPATDSYRELREEVAMLKSRVESLNNVATAQFDHSQDDVALGQKVATEEVLQQLNAILDESSDRGGSVDESQQTEDAEVQTSQ
jgi:DNA-binding MarR family transcriptional regulator